MVTIKDLLFMKLHKTSKAAALFLEHFLVHILYKNYEAHSPSILVESKGTRNNHKSKFTHQAYA